MPRITNAEVFESPEFQKAYELGSIYARHNPASARRTAARVMAREIQSIDRVFGCGLAAGIIETIGMGDYYAECEVAPA